MQEMKRLVRPGGMIAVFDGDYASMTFGNANWERGQALDRAIISGVVTSPYVMRLMPRMLKDVGLELTATLSNVLAEVGRGDSGRRPSHRSVAWCQSREPCPKKLRTFGRGTC